MSEPTVHHGDCVIVMAGMPEVSVDAIVCDPPYELGFMGKCWDSTGVAYDPATWRAALRVLKPGGHLLAFGGTRTWHRLAVAVEDAGFEIRDSIAWMYGSGFPKSLDVSKAIDKAAGAERTEGAREWRGGQRRAGVMGDNLGTQSLTKYDTPATDDARKWEGWGTALKPAFEPIVVARKPLVGTVAANVLAYGTGALNIDGCRIGDEVRINPPGSTNPRVAMGDGWRADAKPTVAAGRWPANVVLDEDQAAALDAQSGTSSSRKGKPRSSVKPGDGWGMKNTGAEYDDQGGASRFFFVTSEEPCKVHEIKRCTICLVPAPDIDDINARFRYCAKAPKNERPFYFRQSCECEDSWPSRPRDTTESASAADLSWSTSTSGSSITGEPSRPGTTSITGTATNSTTTSATSSSSPSLSTNASTQGASSAMGSGGNPAESAASSSQSVPTTGISAEMGGRSTEDAAPAISSRWSEKSVCGSCGAPSRREAHATVKPLSLMRWLVRLVTPPGGVVLDPFAGSGTTLEAAMLEGFDAIGIEQDATYLPLIQERIRRSQEVDGPDEPTLFGESA